MVDEVITAIVGISILGGAYVVDLIVGLAKVAFTPEAKFSFKKMFTDFVKAIMIAGGIVGLVVLLNAINWWAKAIGADLAILNGMSTSVLFAGILGGSVWYAGNALRNITKFINAKNIIATVDPSKADYRAVAEKTAEAATLVSNEVSKFLADIFTKEEAVEAHREFEQNGGRGAAYSVPIGSYDQFRAAVIGRAYDIDGAYGAQCWDGAALLWQQIGRSLSTGGTGAAKGCWTHARSQNAGGEFDLISDFGSLRRGDVIVFGYGQWGHIAFVDNVNPLRILGQNQTGTGNGAPFNVINASASGFIGAFRLKRWDVVAPAPTPASAPAPKATASPAPAPVQTVPNNPVDSSIKVGDSVIAWGAGTADSYGGGGRTREFPETRMKVIGINNGHYALNQYDQGTPGNVADTTGWWPADRVRKA